MESHHIPEYDASVGQSYLFEIEVQATKKEKGRCIELINKLDSITDGKTIVKKHAEAKILEFPELKKTCKLDVIKFILKGDE